MTNEFTCEICKNTYKKEWTDDEAHQEDLLFWTEKELADGVIVCEDCWLKVMKRYSEFRRNDDNFTPAYKQGDS